MGTSSESAIRRARVRPPSGPCRLRRGLPPDLAFASPVWPSLADKVPYLDARLEQSFRLGHGVWQAVVLRGATYEKWGTLSGGMTMVIESAREQELVAYHGWRGAEGFPPMGIERILEAYEGICRFLDGVNAERAALGMIPLTLSGRGERYLHRTFEELQRPDMRLHPRRQVFEQIGGVYRAAHRILEELPRPNLFNPMLNDIRLGESTSSAVRGSEYVPETGQVIMFTLALGAARRTFVGMFLHELGHALARRLLQNEEHAEFFRRRHRWLRAAGAFFGVDFWIGIEDRLFYQADIEEFLAELHMHYVAAGDDLRAHIAATKDEATAKCWREIYAALRDDYFAGVEYFSHP